MIRAPAKKPVIDRTMMNDNGTRGKRIAVMMADKIPIIEVGAILAAMSNGVRPSIPMPNWNV